MASDRKQAPDGAHPRGTCRVALIAGARPNFMKMAPIYHVLHEDPRFEPLLVHTGQHYDPVMSQVFLDAFGLPAPAVNLGVGSGTHASQTAAVMAGFEAALDGLAPDIVLVAGDVNSTLACALVAQRLAIPVGHVEAGLRSGDRSMPEEINRLLTDQLSDWLYTPSPDAEANLLAEGIPAERIVFVGNVMIDTLVRHRERASADPILDRLGLSAGEYALVTLHRPANVDDPVVFSGLLGELEALAERIPVVFPMHPRTLNRLSSRHAELKAAGGGGLRILEPLDYHAFMKLTMDARLVITDSGGIQEETTFLNVPCLTLRENTERPITITEGTNRLVSPRAADVRAAVDETLGRRVYQRPAPDRWDGRTAERVRDHLARMAEQF